MIIFIYGSDTFRSRRKLKELKDKFISEVDPGAASLNIINGENTNLKDFQASVATGSLFTSKRMVVIENIFKNKKKEVLVEILSYLTKTNKATSNNTETILIFFDEEIGIAKNTSEGKALFNWLGKQKYVQEFSTLNNEQLYKYASLEFKNQNKKIDSKALQQLLAITGPNLWRLNQEINKLCNYAKQDIITKDDIALLIAPEYEDNIFALTDALSAKNKKLALQLLENQYLSGSSEEYVLTMLMRQFKIILQIKEELEIEKNSDKISQKLKIHPYVVKKTLAAARNFSAPELKKQLDLLLNIDYHNKRGQGEMRSEISLLIARL